MNAAYLEIGRWLALKYQEQAAKHGVEHATRNMKKQGYPLWFARLVLAGRG